jgi:hypothetical protein
MDIRNLLFGLVGAVIGAGVTYVVMDRVHEKELDDIYAELDEMRETEAEKALAVYGGVFGEDEAEEMLRTHNEESAPAVDNLRYIRGDKTDEGGVGGEYIPKSARLLASDSVTMDDVVAMDEDPDIASDIEALDEDDGPVVIIDAELEEVLDAELEEIEEAAIHIIRNDEVSGRQVVGAYNHDDGSYEIVKALSTTSEHFDDILENDALYSLIGEEAFDILMSAEPTDETRLIAVRNNVINLDFVIRY